MDTHTGAGNSYGLKQEILKNNFLRKIPINCFDITNETITCMPDSKYERISLKYIK